VLLHILIPTFTSPAKQVDDELVQLRTCRALVVLVASYAQGYTCNVDQIHAVMNVFWPWGCAEAFT